MNDLIRNDQNITKNELLFRPLIAQDMNFNGKYYLQLIGILDNSNKITVNLFGIKVFFEVEVNNNYEADYLKSVLKNNKYKNYEIIEANLLKGYRLNKTKYARIFFDNLYDRKKMLDELTTHLNTYSNDWKNYYRKVAREYKLRLTSWNKISNYKKYGKYYYVDINDFKYSDNQSIDGKFLIFAWDIESWSGRGLGDLPMGKYEEDEVFLICICLFRQGDEFPFKKICITTQNSNYDNDWLVLVVKNQKELLFTFANVIFNIKPDIEIGFNSSGYDWPFLIQKIDMFNIFNEFCNIIEGNTKTNRVRYFYIKSGSVKITSDENINYEYFKIPDCISIDIRIALKKIMSPKKPEQSSLRYFLQKYKQSDKIDLEHHILWKYYSDAKYHKKPENESLQDMYTILKYCINDSWSCQRLLISSGLLENYKEISDVAYVSLYDSYNFAIGMKVRNLLASAAYDLNVLINTHPKKNQEQGKFPGAFVFWPIRGLNIQRPVTGLDFESLYPNLIITYNLSPEKIVLNKEEAEKLMKNEIKLHEIRFMFNNSLITAWSVSHNNNSEKMGLYPKVLKQLVEKRKELKKKLNKLKKTKEELETLDQLDENYEKNCFELSNIDMKQLALKIYANSFYGEAGNSLSSLFLRELAGAVTSFGQYNIKLVANYLKKKHYKIIYGDTDSVYVQIPEINYEECDRKYKIKKLYYSLFKNEKLKEICFKKMKKDYWSEMIKITMKIMDEIKNEVNEMLFNDNGGNYLKMAYEEVLFPFFALGKKKYCGIPHINEVNFTPKNEKNSKIKPFIRGIDLIKQHVSPFLKNIGQEIIDICLNVYNEKDVINVVKDVLELKIKNYKSIDKTEFLLSASWKINVDNKSVKKFIKRLHEKGLKDKITPGERFKYLIIQTEKEKQGKKDQIGNKMELLENIEIYNLEIDIIYYLNSVVNICARYINYYEEFQPDKDNNIWDIIDDEEKMGKIDEYSQKKAEKYIKDFIKEIYNKYYNLRIYKINQQKRKLEDDYRQKNKKLKQMKLEDLNYKINQQKRKLEDSKQKNKKLKQIKLDFTKY